jgi:hypothetical protein
MTSYEFKKTLEQNNWQLVSNNEIILAPFGKMENRRSGSGWNMAIWTNWGIPRVGAWPST